MPFGQERVEPYVVGDLSGHLITADFGRKDRILFLLMGAALAEIQSFEFLVAHVLAVIAAHSHEDAGGKDFDKMLETNFEKCIGPLIKSVRNHSDNGDYAQILEVALGNRNLFIHRFLRQHEWPMDTDEVYLQAVRHLQDIRGSIHDAEGVVHRILSDKRFWDVIVIEFDPRSGLIEL